MPRDMDEIAMMIHMTGIFYDIKNFGTVHDTHSIKIVIEREHLSIQIV